MLSELKKLIQNGKHVTDDEINFPIKKYRTLFLSDLHLGTRAAQAELLLDFLKYHDAETIYLVGDIVDGWRLKKGWYWPQAHNDVVQKFLRKVRKGVRVIYIPGNHDEFARNYTGLTFGGIEVVSEALHKTADDKKIIVMHGDQFDIVVCNARWLAYLGDWAYRVAIATNTWVNSARRLSGMGYWSLSAWAKMKVKNAVNFIGDFEKTLALEAKHKNADGVICGHIHHATIKQIDDALYINTGDFVESCSAVVEHQDGHFEIIYWQMTAQEQMNQYLKQNIKTLPRSSPKAA